MNELDNQTTDQAGTSNSESTSMEQYADMFKDEAPAEQGTPDKESEGAVGTEGKDLPETEENSTDAFEIGKDFSLKIGDKITPDHIKQLERGFLRESDYTRKTQELSQVRQQANEVLEARDLITQDPRSLRQFLNDDHILKAFTPHELLVAGLTATRIPPEAWNEFLKNFQENGGAAQSNWRADPNAPVLGGLQKEIGFLKNKLTTFERADAARKAEQENREQMAALDREVDDVLKKFPGIKKRELLLEIGADSANRTVEQVARWIQKQRDLDRNNYLQGKEENKNRKIQPPKGKSVPIMPKAPTKWAEADAILNSLHEAGQL